MVRTDGDEAQGRIAIIARGLRDAFGARAIEVATRQRVLGESDGDPGLADVWDAVIAWLEANP